MKITTSSGSKYDIDLEYGIWRKNGGVPHQIDWVRAVESGERQRIASWRDLDEHSEERTPRVGEHLYIKGSGVWWLSTEIVSIEDD